MGVRIWLGVKRGGLLQMQSKELIRAVRAVPCKRMSLRSYRLPHMCMYKRIDAWSLTSSIILPHVDSAEFVSKTACISQLMTIVGSCIIGRRWYSVMITSWE